MIDTNQEKALKIEQKLLITITSTVNVKNVSGRGERETIGNSSGNSIIKVNPEYYKIRVIMSCNQKSFE